MAFAFVRMATPELVVKLLQIPASASFASTEAGAKTEFALASTDLPEVGAKSLQILAGTSYATTTESAATDSAFADPISSDPNVEQVGGGSFSVWVWVSE